MLLEFSKGKQTETRVLSPSEDGHRLRDDAKKTTREKLPGQLRLAPQTASNGAETFGVLRLYLGRGRECRGGGWEEENPGERWVEGKAEVCCVFVVLSLEEAMTRRFFFSRLNTVWIDGYEYLAASCSLISKQQAVRVRTCLSAEWQKSFLQFSCLI